MFKVNSLTLDAEYERVALNMWVIPHNEAAKEHCAVYYEKQPKAKHILGDGGPLFMPRGTRGYGFKQSDYEYMEDGDNAAYGTGLCIGCYYRNRNVVAERRTVVREALEALEAIKTTDVQRANDFVAAMRELVDSFAKKPKKPGSEKDDRVRKAHGSSM